MAAGSLPTRFPELQNGRVSKLLRDVVESDVPVFFEHQRDPEATSMADFPARDREAFGAHWQRILCDEALTARTIVFEGHVAGNVGSWEQDGRRLVGYWLGREFWGKGLATQALARSEEHTSELQSLRHL